MYELRTHMLTFCGMGVQVERMVARLTDRVEELAVRPEDGTATLSAHVLVSCRPNDSCLLAVPSS